MNNYLLFIPGNTTSDKVAYLFFLFTALGLLYFAVKKTIWLFKKDSYWYYWRYWNPFTFVFYKRFSLTWFIRFVAFVFLYGSFHYFSNRHQDTFGIEDAIGKCLWFLLMFILMYGLCTLLIARDDDSESEVVIREAKRHYGKLEANEEPTKEKLSKANESVADELIKLNELKERGLLTEEEFEEQKKKQLKQ